MRRCRATPSATISISAAAAPGRGLRFRVRVRLLGLLGLARRGRRDLSQRPRLHRRRRRAQPSALWRLRPQQRARGLRSISAGSSRRRSKAGAARGCSTPIRLSASRCFATSPRISSPRAFARRAISSRATTRRATARNSSAPGPNARTTSASASTATSRITRARRWCSDRKAAGRARTAIIRSRRAPAIIWRRSRCRPAATCSKSWAPASRCSRFDAASADVERLATAARACGVPLKVVRDSVAGGRENYEAQMILVRPDQFVAFAGDTAPADPDALMRRVSGQS